jgi:uncharacterized protein (DUF362 family)
MADVSRSSKDAADAVGVATSAGIQAERIYDNPDILAELIRRAVACAEHPQQMRSLRDLIVPGATVLVKPNWVYHENRSGGGMAAMVTHPNFVIAALTEVLRAKPRHVVVCDAPIQGCIWQRLISREFTEQLLSLGASFGVEVEVADIRRSVARESLRRGIDADQKSFGEYVLFDLKEESLLEPVTGRGRFRITDYDPDKLAQRHGRGVHKYLVHKSLFLADFVLSLPKLKTHKKVGFTGALKNLVGINGDKDFLPHYRAGKAGDSHPGRHLSLMLAERLSDRANLSIGHSSYAVWSVLRTLAAKCAPRRSRNALFGSWWGNDTCWRMVLDLNRIALYGRADGTMADSPVRRVYSLTDAIVCGQGDGPLRPFPLQIGAVTFSASSMVADLAHAALLHVNPFELPILRAAAQPFRWSIGNGGQNPRVVLNGGRATLEELARQAGRPATLPSGWAGSFEWRFDSVGSFTQVTSGAPEQRPSFESH